MTEVHFFEVKRPDEKIAVLVEQVSKCFLDGERVLIRVPSQQVAEYIDDLLWKTPQDSFLPHEIANVSAPDVPVAIVVGNENFNNAEVLLNVCPDSAKQTSYKKIIEFTDKTSPDREKASILRASDYKALKLKVFD